MTRRFPLTASVLVTAALLFLPGTGVGKDKSGGPETPAGDAPKRMSIDKSSGSKDGSASAGSKSKLYRYKGEKKASGPSANQPMTLLVEDVFTGRSDALQVPDDDPASKEYTPLAAVASAVAELESGAVIEVETEKQKGRTVVTSVNRAEYKPGEDLPNGFVFVSSDAQTKGGVESVVVALSKFGREVKVGVPMKKDDEDRDAKMAPDPKVDYVIRRLQSGTVVDAVIKPGRTPMLSEIYEYRKPERGKFAGLKEVEFNSWPAAGFELTAEDGTAITFTLEGTEQSRNGKTQYVPSPQQVAAVRKIKKDTPIEVHYRLDGQAWMLRRVAVLSGDEKLAKAEKADPAERMNAKSKKEDAPGPNKPETRDGKKDGANDPKDSATDPEAEKN